MIPHSLMCEADLITLANTFCQVNSFDHRRGLTIQVGWIKRSLSTVVSN
jgi:hypothetical protein